VTGVKSRAIIFLLWTFGVVLAVIPLVFDYMHQRFGEQPSWISVIMHGELLLIALAILGDTIGRAATSDDEPMLRFPLLLGSIIVAFIVVYDIGEIRSRVADLAKVDENSLVGTIIVVDSWRYFLASLFLSFATVVGLEE
jgi:apolipoprotein N-acyltransferase